MYNKKTKIYTNVYKYSIKEILMSLLIDERQNNSKKRFNTCTNFLKNKQLNQIY